MDKIANITIGKRSNTKDEGCITITISDESSGLRVVEIEMDFKEFAQVMTGLAYCKGKYRFMPNEFVTTNIGKKREVKDIYIDKPESYEKDKNKKHVAESIDKSGVLKDGWMLFDDGLRSQQPSKKHRVTLYRFI